MDSATLRSLGRPALQKLAKENNIKANLKTEIIIDLLQRLHKVVPRRPSISPPQNSPHRSPSPPKCRTPEESALSRFNATIGESSTLDNSCIRQTVEVSGSVDKCVVDSELREDNIDDIDNLELQYPASPGSTYTFGTPESSLAWSPEPEAPAESLRHTVECMAIVNETDQKTLEQITKLRNVAAKVRSKADDLRCNIRAERAIRERIQNYMTYWRRIDPRWTYVEVWGGMMRVRDQYNAVEITTSDEEVLEGGVAPGQCDTVMTTVQGVEEAYPERFTQPSLHPSPVSVEAEVDSNQGNGKRSREETEIEDNPRYRPRPRMEVTQLPTGDLDVASPIQESVDKGKGKILPGQVEEVFEQQGKWDPHVPTLSALLPRRIPSTPCDESPPTAGPASLRLSS